MLYYDRIDISEGVDPIKTNEISECMICHYWFFNDGFGFQDCVCNDCHDLKMLFLNKSNVTMIAVKNVDYHCIIHSN